MHSSIAIAGDWSIKSLVINRPLESIAADEAVATTTAASTAFAVVATTADGADVTFSTA